MSTASTSSNGNNAQITNYDITKIFIRDNKYEQGSYLNDGYDTLSLSAGTLLGRVGASDLLVKHFADAADGSQYPVGILAHDVEIDVNATKTLTYCIAGEVDKDSVILNDADTLEVLIDSRRLKDWIKDIGIYLVDADELSGYDNA